MKIFEANGLLVDEDPPGWIGFHVTDDDGTGYAAISIDQADALAKELARRVTDERVRRAELERSKTP